MRIIVRWKGSNMRFMNGVGNTLFAPVRAAIAGTLVAAAFTCVTFVLSTGAEAQVTTKKVVLIGDLSGKCVNVAGGSTASGAQIVQWICDGAPNSEWTLKPQAAGPSPQVLVVSSYSGLCLSVSGGSPANGAPVVQSNCTGVDSQLWTVASYGKFYRLIAKHSGQCLNVQGGVATGGAPLVQWPCVGATNELWSFSEGFLAPTDPSRIVNGSSSLCADIQSGSTAEGAPAIQWPCKTTGTLNQLWTLQRASDGYQVLVQKTGKCLSPAGGSASAGAVMTQVACSTAALGQVWYVNSNGTNFTLVNKLSGLCLDLGGTSAGSYLVQKACTTNSTTQSWLINNQWERGAWSPQVSLPLVPVAAAALQNNKVMFWAAYDDFAWTWGTTFTQTVLYDLATDTGVHATVSNTGHDMFCPATAMLPDGRLLVNGGAAGIKSSIYDPVANTWSSGGDMNIARGYNTDAVTSAGNVFTIGGSWNGTAGQDKTGELWSTSSGWKLLSGIPAAPMMGPDPAGPFAGDNHAWLFSVGGGTVFQAGPSAQMNWFYTTANGGAGSYASAGNRGTSPYSMAGNAVMYDVNRILTVGGGQAYRSVPATNSAYTINIGSGVTVTQTGSMAYPRMFANGVVLPNGKVFVAGGQSFSNPFFDSDAILPGELWDPSTGQFGIMNSARVPRTYHSIGLLLPDARVLVGGGGLCGDGCDNNHPDFQYYSPGYLFTPNGLAATRPVITTAPTTAGYNATISVTTNTSVASFVMIRMGATTHTVNTDQRRIPLSIASQSGNTFLVKTPANSGIGTPGYYMLFALDANGVPSIAKIIRIG